MSKYYEFLPGLLETTLRFMCIDTRDKMIENTRIDLVLKVRDLALKYHLSSSGVISNFFNYESLYLLKHGSYDKKTVTEDSFKAYSIFDRAMRIKYEGKK